MKKVLIVVVLLILAFYSYKVLQPKNATTNFTTDAATDASTVPALTSTDFDDIPPSYMEHTPKPQTVSTLSFVCDGRMHCSQMSSCAEATYFIQHCPNTKMDGNNDGIPCEQQWCK